MRQYFFKAIGIAVFTGLLGTSSMAQDKQEKKDKPADNEEMMIKRKAERDARDRAGDNEEIIIRKKGDKDTKVTVEIHGDDVIVNGKPLADFNDDNIVIRKRRAGDMLERTYSYTAPPSPFRGGAQSLGNLTYLNANRAFMGVFMAKDDNGAKITEVIKGSPAEKAGLKDGDIITRVNDAKIEAPQDLTNAISKYKPEDKIEITYKRNNKENKVNVTLGKQSGNLPENFEFPDLNRNFNFNFDNSGENGYNLFMRSNSPKIGIKAQDTEDGKGVKVLDVDDGSNAQKAGIKENDILTEFDGKAVNSAAELAEAARNAKDKNTVKVKVNRNGKTQDIEIRIPKKLKTATL